MTIIISSILFIFTFFSLGIAAAILMSSRTNQGRLISFGIFCAAAGSFAYGMEFVSPRLETKLLWIIVRYGSSLLFVLVMSQLVYYFVGISGKIRLWLTVLSSIIPVISVYMLITYPVSHLMYDQIWLDNSYIVPMFQKTVGPFYWLNQLNVLVLMISMIIIVLLQSTQATRLNRFQSWIIASGVSFYLVTELLYLANVRPWGIINISVFSVFPSALIIWYGSQRYHLVNIRPIARALLFEQMQDGILVTDLQGVIVDINPAAQKYLAVRAKKVISKPLDKVEPDLADILVQVKPDQSAQSNRYSEDRIIIRQNRSFQVSISPVRYNDGEYVGVLFIMRDISDRLQAEQLKEADDKRQSAWDERRKIARTLHDSIIQYLNSLALLSSSARQRLEQARYAELTPVIAHISTSARQALKEMRALINELQLESPSDEGFDLIKALEERSEIISSQSGLIITLDVPNTLRLESSEQREIFYILLEALNNCLQHAGASTVILRLQQTSEQFTTEIEDNGCGFDPRLIRQGGQGLKNMETRAAQIAGKLSVTSAPGSGTRIFLQIPSKTQ